MRIGVDARPLASPLTGIGHYVSRLYRAMVGQCRHDTFLFYTHAPIRDAELAAAPNVRVIRLPWPGNIWLTPIWEKFWLPLRLLRDKPDLFHSARTTVPWSMPARTAVTVHDLAFVFFPEIQPWRYRAYWSARLHDAADDAGLVIAVSEATRQDFARILKVDAERIAVVHEAADETAFLPGGGDDRAALLRLGIENPYILFVGTLEPRKGIRSLLDAYLMLPRNIAEGVDLLLVGGRGWLLKDTGALIDDLGPRVRELGYVSDADLHALYRNCEFYVLPSRYEGFGLTVLEAMAAGAPVLTTDAGSLPEIAGDAALLVEPEDPAALSNAMMKLLLDSEIRAELARRGRARARTFSWERAARETRQLFEELAART